MTKSAHYSRWTLRIRDDTIRKQYVKHKRDEVFRNLKLLCLLQVLQNCYLVYIIVATKNYWNLINFAIYICFATFFLLYKRYPWIIDLACITGMVLKSFYLIIIPYL